MLRVLLHSAPHGMGAARRHAAMASSRALFPTRPRLAERRKNSATVDPRYRGPAQEIFVRLGGLGFRQDVGHAEGSRRRISRDRSHANGVGCLCLALYMKVGRTFMRVV